MLFRLSAERKVFLLKGDIPRSAKIASHVMPSNQRGLKVFYHALTPLGSGPRGKVARK